MIAAFLDAYRGYRTLAQGVLGHSLLGEMQEEEFMTAAVYAVFRYDACRLSSAARWPVVQEMFGGFRAANVMRVCTGIMSQTAFAARRSKIDWTYKLAAGVVKHGWPSFRASLRNDGALHLRRAADVDMRGSYVMLRDSLYPEEATERAFMLSVARSRLYMALHKLDDVFTLLARETGDGAATVDLVLFHAAAFPNWLAKFECGTPTAAALSYVASGAHNRNQQKGIPYVSIEPDGRTGFWHAPAYHRHRGGY